MKRKKGVEIAYLLRLKKGRNRDVARNLVFLTIPSLASKFIYYMYSRCFRGYLRVDV